MGKFWDDLVEQLNGYYDGIVALLPKLAMAILAFLIAFSIARWLRTFSKNRLADKMDDPLLADFLSRMIKLTILLIGLLVVLRIVGLGGIATSLMGAAGVSAFVLGFAFKDIGENFLAGIIMAFNRPFRIGDVVTIGEVTGKIIGLTLRTTQIKTFDGKDAYVPNGAIIKNTIINFTIDGFLRYDFTLGLDYDSDVPAAIRIIEDTLTSIDGILSDTKKPMVFISELATSTINLKIMFWVDTFDRKIPDYLSKNEAMYHTVVALSKAGFGMPSDIIEIKNYKEGELFTNTRTGEKAA